MQIFYILVGISVVGIVAVFLLLRKEEQAAGVPLRDVLPSSPPFQTPPAPKPRKPSIFSGFFSKLSSRKKSNLPTGQAGLPEDALPEIPPPLINPFEKQNRPSLSPPAGYRSPLGESLPAGPEAVAPSAAGATAGAGASLSVEEEKRIEQEINLTAQLDELNGKYERLDKLFQEKSAALERSEELLQAELSNRKQFNKVKDMLEKELKEAKDKTRATQVELNAAKAESEGCKKRINHLEEKVTKLEKMVLAKEDEIAGLVKRLESRPSVVEPAPPPPAPLPPAEPSPEDKAGSQDLVSGAGEKPSALPVEQAPGPEPPVPEKREETSEPEAASREQEKEFLKLQPDILTPANPPADTAGQQPPPEDKPEEKKEDMSSAEPQNPEDKNTPGTPNPNQVKE